MDWPTNVKGWNEPAYRGEQYLLGRGSVTLARWSPNRLEYLVDALAPSVMVVNQNYDPSWRAMSGAGHIFLGWIAGASRAGRKEPNRPQIHQHCGNLRDDNFNTDCLRRIDADPMGVATAASRRVILTPD